MLLHFYLFVNAHTQEAHEGVLHEAFDHGATVEPLENHENLAQHEHNNHGQDVYNYDGEMHNELHELVHDGSNFVIEDHVEDHPAWNFMEDANKAAEENMGNSYHSTSAGGTMQANTGSGSPQASRAAAAFTRPSNRQNFNNQAATFNPSMNRSNGRFINPSSNTGTGFNMNTMGTMPNQGSLTNPTSTMFPTRTQSSAPTAGGLGCTTDPAKATAMANQLIGMLFRSSQMMSEIVNMFNTPNPRSTGSTMPTTGSTFTPSNTASRFTPSPTTGFAINPLTSAATAGMSPGMSSGMSSGMSPAQNTYSYSR